MSLMSLGPALWILMTALKTQPEYIRDAMAPPESFTLENFAEVLTYSELRGYVANSLKILIVAVPLLIVTAVAAGYALARLCGRAEYPLLFVFLLSELIPIAIFVIPVLLTVRELGIDSGILQLTLVYAAAMMGFAVLVSWAFFRTVPEQLRDSARLDGCSEFQIFRHIMLPLARSPITLIAVIAVIVVWNEYFIAVVLLDSADDRTLPIGLTEFGGRRTENWPLISAALVTATIPTMVLFGAFQRRIVGQFARSAGG
jgi:ABC-type glycerol-3-phosphate transport system permease component